MINIYFIVEKYPSSREKDEWECNIKEKYGVFGSWKLRIVLAGIVSLVLIWALLRVSDDPAAAIDTCRLKRIVERETATCSSDTRNATYGDVARCATGRIQRVYSVLSDLSSPALDTFSAAWIKLADQSDASELPPELVRRFLKDLADKALPCTSSE